MRKLGMKNCLTFLVFPGRLAPVPVEAVDPAAADQPCQEQAASHAAVRASPGHLKLLLLGHALATPHGNGCQRRWPRPHPAPGPGDALAARGHLGPAAVDANSAQQEPGGRMGVRPAAAPTAATATAHGEEVKQ